MNDFSCIAEAKKQVVRISTFISKPLVLVGGLAVNQYITSRMSRDIDLICSDEMSKKIIDKAFPTMDWSVSDENDDDYRPAFVITNKINKNYPAIKFGPKITERGLYQYIAFEDLFEDAKPFRLQRKEYENILIPSLECLCYMKVISFLCRDKAKTDKLEKDLKDIEDLCNNNSFRLGVFINLVRKHETQEIIKQEFPKRLNYLSKTFSDCNFGVLTNLFYNCIKHKSFVSKTVNDEKFLVVFDVDGTLIKNIRHSWTLLWSELGVDASVAEERKDKFLKGKLSYLDWAAADCETLKEFGFKREHITKIVDSKKCTLTHNLIEAINLLKDNGAVVSIISGGVDALLYELLPEANDLFDDIFINRFVFDNKGDLSYISPTEYDWDDYKKGVAGKNRGLERLCEKYDIPISKTVFVGDDLNDFKAMRLAGRKIFYYEGSRNFGKKRIPTDITMIAEDNLLKVAEEILNNK